AFDAGQRLLASSHEIPRARPWPADPVLSTGVASTAVYAARVDGRREVVRTNAHAQGGSSKCIRACVMQRACQSGSFRAGGKSLKRKAMGNVRGARGAIVACGVTTSTLASNSRQSWRGNLVS